VATIKGVATIQGWLLLKVWLLFKGSYYSRVAIIKDVATIQGWLLLKMWLIFKGSYYYIEVVSCGQVNFMYVVFEVCKWTYCIWIWFSECIVLCK